MRIVETNNPKQLKGYIRYVVQKYHELANKYQLNLYQYTKINAELACSNLEKIELEKDKLKYIEEIRNLYKKLSELLGDKKLVDVFDENVLQLDVLNNSQMKLFENDADELIVNFKELNLDDEKLIYDGKVDKISIKTDTSK